MHDETIHQATVAGVVGASEVAGAGGVVPLAAVEGGAGQAGGGVAVSGQPEGGEMGGGVNEEEEEEGQGRATGVRFELGASRRSFRMTLSEIEGVNQEEVVTSRVDPQKMAAIVISLLWRDSRPDRRKKFERFAAQGDYDITLLERLPEYGRAVWYLRRQQRRVLAVASGPAVPEAERLKAFELRGYWMSELGYHCDDMPEVLAELEHLRDGSGHQDLVNDLETLLEIASRPEVRARLEASRKYRPDAEAEALRLSDVLMQSMGVGEEGEAERLTGQLQRAVTLMVRGYEKHSTRGKFLFHEVEDVEVTYPSLYTASRSPRRKRRAGEPGSEAPEGEAGGGEQVDP